MNERANRTVPETVGLVGFEPAASCTRGRRSTKLSHSPRPIRRPYFAHFRKLARNTAAGQVKWRQISFQRPFYIGISDLSRAQGSAFHAYKIDACFMYQFH